MLFSYTCNGYSDSMNSIAATFGLAATITMSVTAAVVAANPDVTVPSAAACRGTAGGSNVRKHSYIER